MPTAAWPIGLPRHLAYPDVALDTVLISAAASYPDRIALRDNENQLTYGELLTQARHVAGGLRARGIHSGDVIALHMPNSVWFAVAYYGALLAGATVAPINPAQPASALRQQLTDVRAVAVITSPLAADRVLDANVEQVRLIIGVPGDGELPGAVTKLADVLDSEPLDDLRIDPTMAAHLQLTGGTTGRSKAVRVLHRNVVANILQCAAWRASALGQMDANGELHLAQIIEAVGPHTLTPGHSVHLGIAPLFHGLGLVGLNIEIALGTTIIFPRGFHPDQVIVDIQRHRVTHLIGSPPMYYALLRSPKLAAHDTSSVRMIISGAAPIDTSTLAALAAAFPNAGVTEGYGCSEATMGLAFGPVWCDEPSPLGSVGLPLFDTEIELRDSDGNVVPDGAVGELCARGPQISAGYLNEPELTANQFHDGWLLTGDMGRRDERGFIYLIGRAKDMVIYKGYNVYPQPLEDLLCSHPSVTQAAVVGRPDVSAGEIPVGFIVLSSGTTNSSSLMEEVMAFVAERVAPYQKVRELYVVDALPLTPTGKVLKSELRDQLVIR